MAHIVTPRRMQSLPHNERGMVPWFVAKLPDGSYDHRIVDTSKVAHAHNKQLCWLCGQKLGAHLAFVIGPMCIVNRISSEPPSHRECAEYAAMACPFLSNPAMRRSPRPKINGNIPPAGFGIERNPGVAAVWMTKSYKPFEVQHPDTEGGKGWLFKIGDPEEVIWYCRGRAATYQEVVHSLNTGLPLLFRVAEQEGPDAIKDLEKKHRAALKYLPAAA